LTRFWADFGMVSIGVSALEKAVSLRNRGQFEKEMQ
jgi:hypothetical protein